MEAVLRLVKVMQPFYSQGGRPSYGLETMLRIHLMQSWWSLTGDAMEDALIDTGAVRRFARIDLAKDNIPDATIIHAPTSTKNEKREREPQMHQTLKGNQWFFGMKVRLGWIRIPA